MTVSEIGEFGLIRLLASQFGIDYPPSPTARRRPGFEVDLGDDAAVTARHDGSLIWTTDTMVAGIHFLPSRTAWRDVGWKALAVNLSDIAAMGGTPHLALVTLSLPEDFRVADAADLYAGLNEAALAFDVLIGGGDIVRCPVFSITLALSGWAYATPTGEPQVMTRHAARPGDIVAVSGSLGDSAAGLLLIRGDLAADAGSDQLRRAHERPDPRVALGLAAVKAGVRCAIDISDGLVQDLGHIATASDLAIRLDLGTLPVSDALRRTYPERCLALALSGGEDYELALVAPPAIIEGLQTSQPVPLTTIGSVERGAAGVRVFDAGERLVATPAAGWDHFARP